MKYELLSHKTLIERPYICLEEAHLEIDTFRGNRIKIRRMGLKRPKVVGMLVYHSEKDALILVKQFRYSAVGKKTAWVTEIVAGVVDQGDKTYEDCAVRECIEEIGYKPERTEEILAFMPSVGFSDQQVYLFYAEVTEKNKLSDGGGLIDETEDIEVIEKPVSTMLEEYKNGAIYDAKTLIAFQWFMIHKRS